MADVYLPFLIVCYDKRLFGTFTKLEDSDSFKKWLGVGGSG